MYIVYIYVIKQIINIKHAHEGNSSLLICVCVCLRSIQLFHYCMISYSAQMLYQSGANTEGGGGGPRGAPPPPPPPLNC